MRRSLNIAKVSFNEASMIIKIALTSNIGHAESRLKWFYKIREIRNSAVSDRFLLVGIVNFLLFDGSLMLQWSKCRG